MLSAVLQVLAAYVLVDLFTGLYHLWNDSGYGIQTATFQEHHEINTMERFDWQPAVFAGPIMLLGLWIESSFTIAFGAFGILGQVPHYYAHRRSKSRTVHRIVRALQLAGIIISPEHHARHHDGQFNRNFCIVSGWNNWWLNRLVAPFVHRS